MQKNKLILLGAGLISFFTLQATFAESETCKRAIHCASVSGLSNSEEGRYIKISRTPVGTMVVCAKNNSSFYVSAADVGAFMGSNNDQYSICTGPTGRECEAVASDVFTIKVHDKQYQADPRYFNVDLSAVKDRYPAC